MNLKKIVLLYLFTGALSNVFGQSNMSYEQIQELEYRKSRVWQTGQQKKGDKVSNAPEQDCINAIEVCDTFYVQTQSYQGPGNIPNEINGGHFCYTSSGGTPTGGYIETNSVWYRIRVLAGGTLNFSIIPLDPNDDYDWVVFNLTNAPCENIFFDPSLRVACNFSAIPGVTGANGLAGNPNAPALNVNAGETYLINVNNFSSTVSGYRLSLSQSTAQFRDTIPPVVINAEEVCKNYGIRITTNELVKCSSIDANGNDFRAFRASDNSQFPIVGAVGVGCTTTNIYTNKIDVMLDTLSVATAIRLRLNQSGGVLQDSVLDKCDNPLQVLDTTITMSPKPKFPDMGPNLNYCLIAFNYPLLDPKVNAVTYLWNTGANTPTLQATEPGLYWVEVNYALTADPCVFRDSVILNVGMEYCTDNLPNAFTPNGDGFNDVYAPGIDLPVAAAYNIRLTILNRWGQVLFEGQNEWDGKVNGALVESGTYYAVIKYNDPNDGGKEKSFKTPVTLIRKN